MKFLLTFAVLAPSSHNSQPWRFEIKENEINIFLEPARRLIESDKNDRQAYISLGCAITNIVTAADYYGLSCNVAHCPDKNDNYLAARITIPTKSQKAVPSETDHFIFSIPKRVTNRNQYANKLPPETFLSEIKSLNTSDLSIYIIIEQQKKNQLADVALLASIDAMEDGNFRRELSQYVKSNTTLSPIGMPGFGIGLPTPVSFIAPIMIKYLNMNKLNHKKDEALLKKHTPAFVIIATSEDNRPNWIETGELYERIALLATREGLSTAMWAAPIQISEHFKELQKILQTEFRPQALFRLGYPVKPTLHSPRLMIDKVLIGDP